MDLSRINPDRLQEYHKEQDEIHEDKMSNPNTHLGQAKILLNCIDNEDELIHWLWCQDFFLRENEKGEFISLLQSEVHELIVEAGGTSEDVRKIINIMEREKA